MQSSPPGLCASESRTKPLLHPGGVDHGRSKKYLCSLGPSFYLIFALGGEGMNVWLVGMFLLSPPCVIKSVISVGKSRFVSCDFQSTTVDGRNPAPVDS